MFSERTWDLSENSKTQVCEQCANELLDFFVDAKNAVIEAYRRAMTELYL